MQHGTKKEEQCFDKLSLDGVRYGDGAYLVCDAQTNPRAAEPAPLNPLCGKINYIFHEFALLWQHRRQQLAGGDRPYQWADLVRFLAKEL